MGARLAHYPANSNHKTGVFVAEIVNMEIQNAITGEWSAMCFGGTEETLAIGKAGKGKLWYLMWPSFEDSAISKEMPAWALCC